LGTNDRVLQPGNQLGDRYRLDECVGTGGMGAVWRATDTVLARTVALKVLLPALLDDPGFDARFVAEARIMAALRHRGVVDVYDYGKSQVPDNGMVAYLVMEYVDGQPLSRRIADSGRLSVDETLSVVAQAADALQAAHTNGIIHRDVKPANLLIQPDGTVVLVDFGVARMQDETTMSGRVLGTAAYMAPEQASGRGVSPATDIYALGVVAYHCLAGSAPFTDGTPVEIAVRHLSVEPPPLPEDVPAPVRALVERAMAKDPADRYPSAAAMATAARAALDGGAATTTAPMPVLAAVAAPGEGTQPFEPAVPSKKRRNALLVATALVVLGLGGLIAALGLRGGGADTPGQQQLNPAASSAPATSHPPTRRGGSTPGPSTVRSTPPAAVTTGPAEPVQTTGAPPPPPPTTGGPEPSGVAASG
jgi:serine/threonine-protein kinase